MAKKQKKNKKWIWFVAMLVLFACVAVTVFLIWNFSSSDKKDNGQQKQHTEVREEKRIENTKEADTDEQSYEKPKVVQYDGEDPNDAETLSGVITYVGVNNGILMIRVNIDQFVEGGVCNLILERDGNAIFGASTEIIENASTATCDGYDIPIDGLGSGLTKIVINLDDGLKTGELSGEVEI